MESLKRSKKGSFVRKSSIKKSCFVRKKAKSPKVKRFESKMRFRITGKNKVSIEVCFRVNVCYVVDLKQVS